MRRLISNCSSSVGPYPMAGLKPLVFIGSEIPYRHNRMAPITSKTNPNTLISHVGTRNPCPMTLLLPISFQSLRNPRQMMRLMPESLLGRLGRHFQPGRVLGLPRNHRPNISAAYAAVSEVARLNLGLGRLWRSFRYGHSRRPVCLCNVSCVGSDQLKSFCGSHAA